MARDDSKTAPIRVHFAELAPGMPTPVFAAYETDVSGRPLRKLAVSKEGSLDVGDALDRIRYIGLGPDTDHLSALTKDALTRYRRGLGDVEDHLPVSAAPLVMPRAAGIATEGTPPSSPVPASVCRRRKL